MPKSKTPDDITRKVSEDGVKKEILIFRKEDGAGTKKKLVLTDEGAEYIQKLTSFGCTVEEIITDIGVSEPIFYRPYNKTKFQEAVKKGQANFTMSVRQQAMRILKGGKGNAAMGIFMCKSVLHMSDQVAPSQATTSPIEEFAKELKKYEDEDE